MKSNGLGKRGIEAAAFVIAADIERMHFDELSKQFNTLSRVDYTDPTQKDKHDFIAQFRQPDRDLLLVGEIKIRSFPMSRFRSGFLEESKYNSLVSTAGALAEKHGKGSVGVMYLHFYTCGNVLVWDLVTLAEKGRISFGNRRLVSRSMSGSGATRMKSTAELDYVHAVKHYRIVPPAIQLDSLIDRRYGGESDEDRQAVKALLIQKCGMQDAGKIHSVR